MIEMTLPSSRRQLQPRRGRMSLRVCARPPKARILGRLASPRERDRGDTRYRWGSRLAAAAARRCGSDTPAMIRREICPIEGRRDRLALRTHYRLLVQFAERLEGEQIVSLRVMVFAQRVLGDGGGPLFRSRPARTNSGPRLLKRSKRSRSNRRPHRCDTLLGFSRIARIYGLRWFLGSGRRSHLRLSR